jgi:DNA (cytosine-5)-methyltransferase 1
MFGLRTYRHRWFEIAGPLMLAASPHPRHRIRTSAKKRRACWDVGMHVSVTGDVSTYVGRLAMGIDWMTSAELSQAIPPVYTEYIGAQLLDHLREAAA